MTGSVFPSSGHEKNGVFFAKNTPFFSWPEEGNTLPVIRSTLKAVLIFVSWGDSYSARSMVNSAAYAGNDGVPSADLATRLYFIRTHLSGACYHFVGTACSGRN